MGLAHRIAAPYPPREVDPCQLMVPYWMISPSVRGELIKPS
jgi:hypothetical protein